MRKFSLGFIIGLLINNLIFAYADTPKAPPPIQDLPTYNYLKHLYDNIHILNVVTTAPNGNRRGRNGEQIIFNNSGTYELWINTNPLGGTTWQRIQ